MLDASMILCTHWRFYSSWIQYHVEQVGTWQKNILVNPLACNIFYTKKKKKNPMLKALLSLSLEVDENDIWFSKNEQNWTL